MNSQLMSKLEVNVFNANTKPQYVTQFVVKHKIPAIVAAPEYIAPLVASRTIMGGNYKIICGLDFPKGENFAMDKLFRSNKDFIAADGYDILLSLNKTQVESQNEIKTIYEYLKANKPLTEIRWCLNMHRSNSNAEAILKLMPKFAPSFIRVDPHLAIPNVDAQTFKNEFELIRSHAPYPVKFSGNVDLKTINELLENITHQNNIRFDVSIDQAEAIAKELTNLTVQSRTATNPPNNTAAVKSTGKRINI